ncbi:MAG: primosome assembly protein PriA, partial [Propionibacteriaceae bacterium]|nr:primosome assembly protein PriA [Propionibacteriaceae bacterium]
MEKVQIAKVAVDLPLPHLDRAFDYLADGPEAADMSVGVRVKVRFAGQLRFGFVLDLVRELPRNGLSPISKVVSPESVLAPSVASLARSVADYYAGTLADVLRLAVPPRHATTEKSNPIEYPKPILGTPPEVLPAYPLGQPYLEALAAGEHPRSAWQIVPSSAALGDWMRGVLEAAEVALASGRGALLLVPDKKTLDALAALAAARFGKGSFVCLSAEAGPAARYRAFLAARRGAVSLVLGTKAAVFAPVENLGLVSIFDDGNDSYAGLRAPYPHTREVAVMRAYQETASLLIA